MEDYKKKYEDALVKCKELKEMLNDHGDGFSAGILDDIFPELKESLDEGVRKELIQYLKDYPNLPNGHYCRDDFFVWLEKQGHDGKKWIYEDVYIKEKEQVFQDGVTEVLENPQRYGLEKQG